MSFFQMKQQSSTYAQQTLGYKSWPPPDLFEQDKQ